MKKQLAVLALSLYSALASAEGGPRTLLEMAGVHAAPGRLSDSIVVVIDAQREYLDGALPLPGIRAAISEGAKLLARARTAHTPIVHVVHHGGRGLFDPSTPYYAIVPALAPRQGESVVEKALPNAFAGTNLQQVLASTGRKHLIVIGFMTHMCVSATVRAALDRGFTTTVVAGATATRDLPDRHGGTVPAALVQRASLAALADRFATVVTGQGDITE